MRPLASQILTRTTEDVRMRCRTMTSRSAIAAGLRVNSAGVIDGSMTLWPWTLVIVSATRMASSSASRPMTTKVPSPTRIAANSAPPMKRATSRLTSELSGLRPAGR